MAPLVSVVTPVYNGEPFLADCIGSVISQGYSDWEYVIVDNRSTDRSLEIAESFADADARIRVLRSDTFRDIIDNWNYSLTQISDQSTYCKVVCADDWLYPECLEAMVEAAERHPTAGVVGAYRLFGPWVNLDGIQCEGPVQEGKYPVSLVPGSQICRETLRGGPYVFGSNSSVLVRSSSVRARNPFYDATTHHADSLVCYSLLQDQDFAFIHQVLTCTRRHDESTTDTFAKPLRTKLPAKIYRLQQFGSVFLDEAEAETLLEDAILRYLEFLRKASEEGRSEDFWAYHDEELKTLGLMERWSAPLV